MYGDPRDLGHALKCLPENFDDPWGVEVCG